jgi:hypothetical protein
VQSKVSMGLGRGLQGDDGIIASWHHGIMASEPEGAHRPELKPPPTRETYEKTGMIKQHHDGQKSEAQRLAPTAREVDGQRPELDAVIACRRPRPGPEPPPKRRRLGTQSERDGLHRDGHADEQHDQLAANELLNRDADQAKNAQQ